MQTQPHGTSNAPLGPNKALMILDLRCSSPQTTQCNNVLKPHSCAKKPFNLLPFFFTRGASFDDGEMTIWVTIGMSWHESRALRPNSDGVESIRVIDCRLNSKGILMFFQLFLPSLPLLGLLYYYHWRTQLAQIKFMSIYWTKEVLFLQLLASAAVSLSIDNVRGQWIALDSQA